MSTSMFSWRYKKRISIFLVEIKAIPYLVRITGYDEIAVNAQADLDLYC